MFDAEEFIAESIESLKATIDDVAIIACSGGVDSTVAAVIANQAVGDLLHCVYVDTGFMRKDETEQVEARRCCLLGVSPRGKQTYQS